MVAADDAAVARAPLVGADAEDRAQRTRHREEVAAAVAAGGRLDGDLGGRAVGAVVPALGGLVARHEIYRAKGFVALPGGIGTLEELVEIMTWGQLGRHRKPIVIAGLVLAALSLAILPVLILYLIFSRQLIRGITAGAVK